MVREAWASGLASYLSKTLCALAEMYHPDTVGEKDLVKAHLFG